MGCVKRGCLGGRERERDRERQTDRQTDRQADRDLERDRQTLRRWRGSKCIVTSFQPVGAISGQEKTRRQTDRQRQRLID